MLAQLLDEQQDLTAVEEFSLACDYATISSPAARYQRLLPAAPPGPGQQYAFEVDLDRCSGCKACVTACHNLNGLDAAEAWRDVGMGTDLVAAAQRWVRERGLRKLSLGVFPDNARAIAVYEKRGFVREGTRRMQYRSGDAFRDEVLMAWFPQEELDR